MSTSSATSQVSSIETVPVKLLRPDRDGITFRLPTRPGLPPLAILEVKIEVSTSCDIHALERKFGYISRVHTVQVNPKTGDLVRIRDQSGQNQGYSFRPIRFIPGVPAPDLAAMEFEINDSAYHQASCRSKTTMEPEARGKCFCDLDKEFAQREVLDVYQRALKMEALRRA